MELPKGIEETPEKGLTPPTSCVGASPIYMGSVPLGFDLCLHLKLAEEGAVAQGFSLGSYHFCVTPHEHFGDTS